MTLMPLFLTKYDREGFVVGRLLAGYGELEYHLAECVADHVHSEDAAFRLLFQVRLGETNRLAVAHTLIRGPLTELGLGAEYEETHVAMGWCTITRNQYAHCHWTETHGTGLGIGLAFVQLKKRYAKPTTMPIVEYTIDLDLLKEQEDYFCYTRDCLVFLHRESMVRRGKLKRNHFDMPSKTPPPLRHRSVNPFPPYGQVR